MDKATTHQGRNYYQYIAPLMIILAVFMIYNPVLNNGILDGWDDTEYFTYEEVSRQNIPEIFSSYHLGMYQPLAVLTLSMNYDDSEANARTYHATSLFLHILNILLVWLFILALSGRRTIAGIVAFLFAFHPMNVESVAWISARSTLLFTAFYLGGLLAYLKYLESRKPLYLIITFLLAILSFFSKSLAMSFPFVLLAIDYFKHRKWSPGLALEKLPFLILSVIFGLIAIDAAEAYGHITGLQQDYSLIDHFFILCHTYVFYLFKFAVPVNLSPIYAYPDTSGGSLPLLYYLSPLIPIILLIIIYRYRNKQREVIAALLFFSLAVAPVLPLFWSRIFVAADRYAYLSFVGLFLLGAILIERLFSKGSKLNAYIRYTAAVLLVCYGIFLMYTTHFQTRYWKDAETLLDHSVLSSSNSGALSLSYFYRGNILQNSAEKKHIEGQRLGNEKMVRNSFLLFRDAIRDYDSTLSINPAYMMAHTNRGIIYGTLSAYDEKYIERARSDFDAAIGIDPTYADNYYNKAWILFMEGDTTGACGMWRKADSLGSAVAAQAMIRNCSSQ